MILLLKEESSTSSLLSYVLRSKIIVHVYTDTGFEDWHYNYYEGVDQNESVALYLLHLSL